MSKISFKFPRGQRVNVIACSFTPSGAKKGAPAAKGKPGAAKDAPAVKKWTKEDDAARKIQTCARGYIARKELQKRKKEKQDYEEMIERLEKEVSEYSEWRLILS